MTVHNGRTGKRLARAAHLTARSWCVSIDAAAGWICVAFLARFADFTLLSLRGSIDLLGSRFRPCGINTLELVTLIFASWNQMREWLRRVEALRQSSVRLWIYRVRHGQTRSNDMIAIAARQPSPARAADRAHSCRRNVPQVMTARMRRTLAMSSSGFASSNTRSACLARCHGSECRLATEITRRINGGRLQRRQRRHASSDH